jgi:hypothetical protein
MRQRFFETREVIPPVTGSFLKRILLLASQEKLGLFCKFIVKSAMQSDDITTSGRFGSYDPNHLDLVTCLERFNTT